MTLSPDLQRQLSRFRKLPHSEDVWEGAAVRAAVKANRRVTAHLLGQREMPPSLPSYYSPGDDNEAVLCAMGLIDAWDETPGAAAWLRIETRGAR